MYCTKTNKCYFLWESISNMLSVLFATEAWYTIKENNREKSFCQGKLPFFWHKLPFCQLKLRKVEAKNLNFNYAFNSVLLPHANTPSPDVCEIHQPCGWVHNKVGSP